jgi:hypothetical protein
MMRDSSPMLGIDRQHIVVPNQLDNIVEFLKTEQDPTRYTLAQRR